MASFVFTAFKNRFYSSLSYNFEYNSYKIVLVNDNFYDPDIYEGVKADPAITMADSRIQSCIISGINLDAKSLINVSRTNVLPYTMKATDVAWQLVTVSNVVGAIVYDVANNLPISFIDFLTTKSATNGTISVPLSRGFIQTP